MAWQSEVGSGSDRATTNHDLVVNIVAFLTSQHVATVAVNAGGTGWTTGDIATLTHAGAYLDARFEVTAVAGAITALRIIASGAFSNRLASAVVNAGGTGYAVGNILEIGGGTSREKAKVSVATLSGSAVATVTVFETGGAYSSAPGLTGATTTKIGPAAGTGSGATLDLTMTGLVGTTALSVTGPGSGATVNITLAETGWSVDGRNTNSSTFNSLTNEKQVVLVGDAAGKTNKPYFSMGTGTSTSGINTRYFVALNGMIAHNPAIALSAQPGLSPGVPLTFGVDASYILCDENAIQEMDFFLRANDYSLAGVININSGAANTDDGQYMHFYAGFGESFATENEDAYPMVIIGSARQQSIDPSVSSLNITGLSECVGPSASATPAYFYRSEDSSWVNIENSENNNADFNALTFMWPMGRTRDISSPSATADLNFDNGGGAPELFTGIGSTGRASPTRRLMPVPGSSPLHLPFPLTIMSRPGDSAVNQVLDTIRCQLSGCFWVYNTTSAAATITNFSEDYLTIGSERYRVFHTHVQRQNYHFIALHEDT